MIERRVECGAAVRYSELRVSVRRALGVLYAVLVESMACKQGQRVELEVLCEINVEHYVSAHEFIQQIHALNLGVSVEIDGNELIVRGLEHNYHGDFNIALESYEGQAGMFSSLRASLVATLVNIPLKLAVVIGFLDLEFGGLLALIESSELPIVIGWASTLWGFPRYVYLSCTQRQAS